VGGELFQAIKESGGLRKPLARFYAAQVVDVLEYLSAHRVLHRDLKPENIYIDDSRCGIRVCVCEYICVCVSICVCVWYSCSAYAIIICTHTHTHTHTHTADT
jgi:serine/threonine protein kinase